LTRSLIAQDAEPRPRFARLLSMPGIAEISALSVLAELALLAPGLSIRRWVAHRPDPAHHDSASSVHKRMRISRARQSPPAPRSLHARLGRGAQ
jgi:hypothetical protein